MPSLVDKVLGDDDLWCAEVADEVPGLPVERLPLQDAVQTPQELLLRLLLRLLKLLEGRRPDALQGPDSIESL